MAKRDHVLNLNAKTKLIHDEIMNNATLWAKHPASPEYFKGKAAGMIYAYLIFTGDEDAYDEYYAMLIPREK